jgi:hypothetical protein
MLQKCATQEMLRNGIQSGKNNKFYRCWLNTADCRPCTANCALQTADYLILPQFSPLFIRYKVISLTPYFLASCL